MVMGVSQLPQAEGNADLAPGRGRRELAVGGRPDRPFRPVVSALLPFTLLIWLIVGFSSPARAQSPPQGGLGGKSDVVRDERAATGRAHADPAVKNVLLLYSGRFIAPLSVAVDEAVRATFRRSPSVKVELYAETLDVARFDPDRYGPLLAAYLREKFADRKLDLIITSLPQAVRFLLKFRKDLFPETPIVYCLADESELADLMPAPGVTGVPIRIPWKETLDLALEVHPDTQRVAVIAGADGLAQIYLRETRRTFRPYENRVAFTYLAGRTLSQLLTEVAGLPPHTVIIYTTFATDSSGQVYIDAEVSGMVAMAASAPVYSTGSTFLGRGITGGRIIDNGAHATRAAEIGLRILAGEKPEAIPVGDVPSAPRFDARQLKRWNIAESRLPAGSIVQYKEPSFWVQYRLLILIVGVCLLEALLILALLVHRRRRRVAEVRLRENEERLRLAMNAAGLGIWTWDIPRDRIVLSERGRKMLAEPPPPEVTYAAFLSMVDREDRAGVDAVLKEAIRTGDEFEIEYRIPQRDGTVVWMASRGRCTHTQAGAPVRMTGVSQVVTERKRAEEELRGHRERLEEMVRERTAELTIAKEQAEKANQAKSTFLANMSHELRTPLNSILGLTQLMEADPQFPQKQRDNLGILGRSGRHLLELIDDLLELSKIEAGQIAAIETAFDLHLLLDDLQEMMGLRAERKGLRLIVNRDPGLPRYVRTDARKLRQILINLLGNAITYTPQGQIRLSLRFQPGSDPAAAAGVGVLAGEVEDTGIGIAPEHFESIFEPFVQLDPGRDVGEGAGLGLALSRSFVRLLGGEITVRSAIGRGSVFSFEIRVRQMDAAEVPASDLASRPVSLAPGQAEQWVLVADDSVDNRLVSRRLLEQAGFRVLEAADGQQAVDLWATRHPSLILMDLRMPVMDGVGAGKRIRDAERGMRDADGRGRHVPIVAVTAHAAIDDGPSGLFSIFDDVLRKPIEAADLFEKIGKHLGVVFVERRLGQPAARAGQMRTSDIRPADLAALPLDWLAAFSQALRRGRSAEMLKLTAQLGVEHADLAQSLAALVRVHAYDRLLVATGVALEEASHG